MKYVLLVALVIYLLLMRWLTKREQDKPAPSFKPWQVRLLPRQKKK